MAEEYEFWVKIGDPYHGDTLLIDRKDDSDIRISFIEYRDGMVRLDIKHVEEDDDIEN